MKVDSQVLSDPIIAVSVEYTCIGFYRGFYATALRDAPFAGVYIVSYETLRTYFVKSGNIATNRFLHPLISLCLTSPE